jgi:hypothetical protein
VPLTTEPFEIIFTPMQEIKKYIGDGNVETKLFINGAGLYCVKSFVADAMRIYFCRNLSDAHVKYGILKMGNKKGDNLK